jgi:hypothetical protein
VVATRSRTRVRRDHLGRLFADHHGARMGMAATIVGMIDVPAMRRRSTPRGRRFSSALGSTART